MGIPKRKVQSLDNDSLEGAQATTHIADGSLENNVLNNVSINVCGTKNGGGHDFAENLPVNPEALKEKSLKAYTILNAIHHLQEAGGQAISHSPLTKILPGTSFLVGGYEMQHNLCGEHGFLKDPTNPESFSKLGKAVAGGAEAFGGPVGSVFAGAYAAGELTNEGADLVLGGKDHSALDILAFDPLISKLGGSMGNFNEMLANKIVGLTDAAENLLEDENEQRGQLPGSINPLRRMQQIQLENHRPRIYPPLR